MYPPNYATIEKTQIAANSISSTDYLFISSLATNSSFGRTRHEIMKSLVTEGYQPHRRENQRHASNNSTSVSRQPSSASSVASSP
jgi:hypothetical protein